jgi:hypothetical protein
VSCKFAFAAYRRAMSSGKSSSVQHFWANQIQLMPMINHLLGDARYAFVGRKCNTLKITLLLVDHGEIVKYQAGFVLA